MAWDGKRSKRRKRILTPEKKREIEEGLGIKIIDTEVGIIEYDGKRWKLIRSMVEFLAVCFDGEPILTIGPSQWVDINYKM